MNPLNIGLEYWLQAHWYSRFSHDPTNRRIIGACANCTKCAPDDDLINLLGVTKQPVFNSSNQLIGMWRNTQKITRPKAGRFFERRNTNGDYIVWVYKELAP